MKWRKAKGSGNIEDRRKKAFSKTADRIVDKIHKSIDQYRLEQHRREVDKNWDEISKSRPPNRSDTPRSKKLQKK